MARVPGCLSGGCLRADRGEERGASVSPCVICMGTGDADSDRRTGRSQLQLQLQWSSIIGSSSPGRQHHRWRQCHMDQHRAPYAGDRTGNHGGPDEEANVPPCSLPAMGKRGDKTGGMTCGGRGCLTTRLRRRRQSRGWRTRVGTDVDGACMNAEVERDMETGGH